MWEGPHLWPMAISLTLAASEPPEFCLGSLRNALSVVPSQTKLVGTGYLLQWEIVS